MLAGAVTALLVVAGQAPVQAAPVDITYVGTWTLSPGAGNPTGVGGPGMSTGQRYVVRITYDDASITTDNVAMGGSGDLMRTINLDAGGNSLDIFVPMEGKDSGSPFVYVQNETNHFPAFTPNPTLNFANGSNISNTANIIGFDFEGDFNPSFAANQNIIEVFNESSGPGVINQTSQILNCFDSGCAGSAIAIKGVNALAEAVNLVADAGSPIVYSAGALTQTTNSSSTNNDLGAARSDGEDFISSTWSEVGGSNLVGNTAGLNNDIAVAILNSGLENTIDTTNWQVDLVEDFTLESDSATTMVSYMNANPMVSASATAVATGYNFLAMITDPDTVVNAIIAGFESLALTAASVDGSDASAFFNDLLTTGSQSETLAALQAAFGNGMSTVKITGEDLAGAMAMFSFNLDLTGDPGPPEVPAPATILLMLAGLIGLRWRARGSSRRTRQA
jgi:hypothetical protein